MDLDPTPNAAADAAAALRAFATDLWRADTTGAANTVLSPWSIAAALVMARTGAAGETAQQIDSVLHGLVDGGPATDLAGWSALDHHLLELGRTSDMDRSSTDLDLNDGVTISRANGVWVQEDFGLEPDFVAMMVERFGAPPRPVDFAAAPEPARAEINRWTSERTAGRIPELLVSGSIHDLTRLVLTNAVHLRAPWAQPFSTAEEVPFHRLDGSAPPVAMMERTGAMAHRLGEDWTSVTVPYSGYGLALTVILPAVGGFERVDQEGAVAEWLTTAAAPDRRPVHLRLPRFELDRSTTLVPVLTRLGMSLAFDPGHADFSAMTRAEPVHIDAVVHQATIVVDEEGTEASAATAIAIAARAAFEKTPPPIEVTVDRPFLFVLHDTRWSAPLFMGRVVDPS